MVGIPNKEQMKMAQKRQENSLYEKSNDHCAACFKFLAHLWLPWPGYYLESVYYLITNSQKITYILSANHHGDRGYTLYYHHGITILQSQYYLTLSSRTKTSPGV